MKHVLIVDDDPGILDALSLMLEMEGYSVSVCQNGHDVEDKLNNKRPDLIVMDMDLSGTDGRNVALNIKNKKHSADIPIVLISAHSSAGQSIEKYKIDEFIPKPFEMTSFLNKIGAYLQ